MFKKVVKNESFSKTIDEMAPLPIKDEVNVDKRRKEMGLEPLAEYAKKMQDVNKK